MCRTLQQQTHTHTQHTNGVHFSWSRKVKVRVRVRVNRIDCIKWEAIKAVAEALSGTEQQSLRCVAYEHFFISKVVLSFLPWEFCTDLRLFHLQMYNLHCCHVVVCTDICGSSSALQSMQQLHRVPDVKCTPIRCHFCAKRLRQLHRVYQPISKQSLNP